MRGFVLSILIMLTSPAMAGDWEEATQGLRLYDGLLSIYTDTDAGRVLALLPKPGDDGISARYIYAGYLTAGLGSNRVGLDRSAGTEAQILAFRIIGGKAVAVIENTDFIATGGNPAERHAVRQSFAQSNIWAGEILATEPVTGRLLIDISGLLLRDAVGVVAQLKRSKQGTFRQDDDLSFVEAGSTLVFPKNAEFDATVTFLSDKPGPEVRGTTPVPGHVTLRAHTTLMALPEPGFKSRVFDERAAHIGVNAIDMSAPLDGNVVRRLAKRFRLEKTTPGAAPSPVRNPIVYYVDNGAPEPILGALVEGASWWSTAFDKAGFLGGFQVKVLPDGVHPQDARYNVINWVHRATRGWSYGSSLNDPRTGEILRGIVVLGSLRVRQDIKIFEGLGGAGLTGSGDENDPVELALDRVRQLSAHEVGHTIGFAHNMAASTYGGRASVMDYPAPLVTVTEDDTLDFSDSYDAGMGSWDDWAVRYLYGDYASDEDETQGQAALIKDADDGGLIYVKDEHSRSVGSAHYKGSLWDNGTDPVEGLQDTMAVRRIALDNFGRRNLRDGERVSALQDKIVPVYLYHRYQLQAAAKVIGGMDFAYSVAGDGRAPSRMLDNNQQLDALEALLDTLEPEALVLDETLLDLLSPLGTSDGDPQFGVETFAGSTGPAFDPLYAAGVAADLTLKALLHPMRAARLVSFRARDADQPGLDSIVDRLIFRTFAAEGSKDNRLMALRRVVQERVVAALLTLGEHKSVSEGVHAVIESRLTTLGDRLSSTRVRDGATRDHFRRVSGVIRRYLMRDVEPVRVTVKGPVSPPGSPIGASAGRGESCWHCGGWESD